MNNHELATHIFSAISLILIVSLFMSHLFKKLGQPPVVSEMITGVVLGPSILGYFYTDFQSIMFPKEILPTLYVIAHIGLSVYMFTVGMEFDLKHIREKSGISTIVSLSGIVFPAICGLLITYYIFSKEISVFTMNDWLLNSLFMASAMSITAFPMLARIISERNLVDKTVGKIALASGAFDDLICWILLSFILSMIASNFKGFILTLGGTVSFILVSLFIFKPLLSFFDRKFNLLSKNISQNYIKLVLFGLMLSSFFTDAIGIFSVFGSFIFGLAMPKNESSNSIISKTRDSFSNLLLPVFFTFSGLNTRLDLIFSEKYAVLTVLIMIGAFCGKGLGVYFSSRIFGVTRSDAGMIASLMNSRGLMELIILNIGLAAGLITREFFSIMVLMAILTTIFATPLFNYFEKLSQKDFAKDKNLAR